MFLFYLRGQKSKGRGWSGAGGSSVKGSGEVIRASATYTSGLGSSVLLKMDCFRVARGGSLSTLHRDFCLTGKFFSIFQVYLFKWEPCDVLQIF